MNHEFVWDENFGSDCAKCGESISSHAETRGLKIAREWWGDDDYPHPEDLIALAGMIDRALTTGGTGDGP